MFITILGWSGIGALLSAYWLVSRKVIASTGNVFQALNFVGAGMICIHAYHLQSWPLVALQFPWMYIALRTMWQQNRRPWPLPK
jgi:hypothetical protein